MSGAGVYRLNDAAGRAVSFVKIDTRASSNGLARERDILLRLRDLLPVPRVLDFRGVGELEALRMTAVPGIDASDTRMHGDVARLIRALADALKVLHALPLSALSGFERGLDDVIPEAARRLAAGEVDRDNFDDDRNATAEQMYEQLLSARPARANLCATHGDYCLPNVLFDLDTFALTGFVDLGRFGIADRYQDLAIVTRSLAHNLGRDLTAAFFEAYGGAADLEKIEYYRLLDEFF
jgi:aminoglycoside phosphotransferase